MTPEGNGDRPCGQLGSTGGSKAWKTGCGEGGRQQGERRKEGGDERRQRGRAGGRDKKGREKKTEGERGLSDILAIRFIVRTNSPGVFAWARLLGLHVTPPMFSISSLRTTPHREMFLEGMVETCPFPNLVILPYDEKRVYFSHFSSDYYHFNEAPSDWISWERWGR